MHQELSSRNYRHGEYHGFYITDPKVRHIHKACVRDRVVHHALFSVLDSVFEPTFISDSYSCRKGYGTHKGFKKLVSYARKVSKNYTQPCWALKCDIRKFFDSVDHEILFSIFGKRVKDTDTLWLVSEIIKSYQTLSGKGIPIGNLTSQLFANVYMNELDQFVKHKMHVKYYLRYTDDFIILSDNKDYLYHCTVTLKQFLYEQLKLELHPGKTVLRRLEWGIDFLGYVALLYHQVLRTKTKKRILKKFDQKIKLYKNGYIGRESLDQTVASYLGVMKQVNTYKLKLRLQKKFP
ncbi:group II intron reverse transcriptase domain-containing protein [Candidatus Microgenomates bacterium]|nr:group II intron reverse transcriptase domain-containing protein [Candidatus Microgenomates bacterium]